MSRAAPLPEFADGQVLVQFNPKARVSAASVNSIDGLKVLRTVGGPPVAGLGGSAASAAAAGGTSTVSAGTVVVFSITDGSSVEDKIKELSSNPGEGEEGWRGWVST